VKKVTESFGYTHVFYVRRQNAKMPKWVYILCGVWGGGL